MSSLVGEHSSRATIARFQRAINKRGRTRGVSIVADGEWGRLSKKAERSIAHRLGMADVDSDPRRRQLIIRYPGKRTPAEVARGGRVVRAWRKKLKSQGTLALRAYRVAEGLVGVMEQGGNNRGPMVSKIIRDNGGDIGEPWCGDFNAYCYRMAGSKAVNRSWASVYYLGRIAGVVKTSKPGRGDIVRYLFSHTGLFDKPIASELFLAIEGNTGASGAVSDSATGGDGVYHKQRSTKLVDDYRKVIR